MAAADAVGRKSAFRRGLNTTRLAVASAVTVLIVLIVAYAVSVVTRTQELSLSVTGGIIYVKRGAAATKTTNATVGLAFSVEANNPGGRARFYYTGINGWIILVNKSKSQNIARFGTGMKDMVVAPNSMLLTGVNLGAPNASQIAPYFDKLYSSSSAIIFSNAMLKLNGTLDVGLYSVLNKTTEQKEYYCWPLTIGAAGNASAPDMEDNVSCETNDPTK